MSNEPNEGSFREHTVAENAPSPMEFIQGKALTTTDGTSIQVIPVRHGGSFKYDSEHDVLHMEDLSCMGFKKLEGDIVQSLGLVQITGEYSGPGSVIRRAVKKNLV